MAVELLVTVSVFSMLAATRLVVLGRLEQPKWNGVTDQDDYDVLNFSPDRPPGFKNDSFTGTVNTTGTTFTAYVARLSAGLPDTFSFQLPIGGMLQLMVLILKVPVPAFYIDNMDHVCN